MSIKPLIGVTIAVTRPLDQAMALNDAILHLGGKAISFPLLAISPLDNYDLFEQQLAELETTDWAIFISSNAVIHAMPRVLKYFGDIPKNLKFAAIGHQTAYELSHYGVHHVLTPKIQFDSEHLLALPEMQNVANLKIAIFRGVGGRELMAETLKSRGAKVYFAESYRRTNPQINANLLEKHFKQGDLHAIVVTSSEAMRYLMDLAGNAEWLKKTPIFVNHRRIAELPISLGLKTYISYAPSDDALIEKIIEIRP